MIGIEPGRNTLATLIQMARGAWLRSMTAAMKGAGADIDGDPFGLFSTEKEPIAPYNPAVFIALQDVGKVM